MGFNDLLKKLFGNKSQRDLKEIEPYIQKIKAISPELEKLTNDELRHRVDVVKQHIQDTVAPDRQRIAELKEHVETLDYDKRESTWEEIDKIEKNILKKIEDVLDESLPEVFAIVKETARRFCNNETIEVTANDFDRNLAVDHDFVHIEGDKAIYANHWMAGGNEVVWDMVHYDVQLIGGVVLHKGKIAEMATGEGKTLVATLPVFLNALPGNGVHVVTVNDYLSKRDSEWMGPLYMFHGLSVDCIDKHEPNSEARRNAYNADITFGTNNEFGFDYLRDNMASSPLDLVQRMHNYAIVDEVDSVLIDDARTPLIISGPTPKGDDQMFEQFQPKVEELVKMQRTLVTKLLAEAKTKIASDDKKTRDEGAVLLYRCFKGLPKNGALIKYLSEPGIKPLMLETEAIYMADNNRRMPEITDDLYFVIDEKNNSIDLTDKGIDVMTGKSDDPNFFVLPNISEELSDLENQNLTPEEKQNRKDELLQNYAIKAERVHTVHQLLKAYTLFELNDQYVVIDNKVKIVDEQTGRIMEGRRYSDGLHQAIEAKENVKVEAATQTFATITLQNYFRMYHKLAGMTGTAETEAGEFWSIYKLDVVVIPTNRPVIRKDEDDIIYKTKKEKYNAVIARIVELTQAGRPVLVGTTSVEISELLSKMLRMRGIKHNVLNAKQHAREAEIVAHAGEASTVTIATNMAGRGTDIKLGPGVKDAGGLAIIGTERHDSRRVDRQLRGRAGRQGDPGSSVFYVSLEDNLLRLFGGERMSALVDKMGLKEGEPLQHPMLSSSIERAQRKVEENNFGIRKRLLEYDDVMNSQREVIYNKRRNALYGERIDVDVMNMIGDCCEVLADKSEDMDYEDFKLEVMKTLSIDPAFDAQFYKDASRDKIAESLNSQIREEYQRRSDTMVTQAWPIIKAIYERQGQQFENVAVPVGDGTKVMRVIVNLKKAYETQGRELVRAVSKTITLIMIDDAWKEHLRDMDDLKQSVQNATYEQKDPLLIYKFESFNLFKSVIERISREVVTFLLRAAIPVRENAPQDVRESERRRTDMSRMHTSRTDMVTNGGQPKSNAPVHVEKKVGRNDPCPCGSGKKYKNCHGRLENN